MAGRLAGARTLPRRCGATKPSGPSATAAVVRSNRQGGPERVIDLIERRAPDEFGRLADVASRDELQGIVGGYAATAGFARVAAP